MLDEAVRTGREVIPGNTTSPSPRGAVLIDRATRVRDGDTIVVGLIPIRIANLNCAESGMDGSRVTRGLVIFGNWSGAAMYSASDLRFSRAP